MISRTTRIGAPFLSGQPRPGRVPGRRSLGQRQLAQPVPLRLRYQPSKPGHLLTPLTIVTPLQLQIDEPLRRRVGQDGSAGGQFGGQFQMQYGTSEGDLIGAQTDRHAQSGPADIVCGDHKPVNQITLG